MKYLVLRSELGKVTSSGVEEGELKDVIIKVAQNAMKEWNERASDFSIMKDAVEIVVPLPFTKEQYLALKDYVKERSSKEALVELPVYVISFDNEWTESDYIDKKVYVIAPFVDSKTVKDIEQYASDLTNPDKKTEEEEEEDLEE
ncbi:MAG: DUF2286 domain-containing protein [Thermoprotei archaeon]